MAKPKYSDRTSFSPRSEQEASEAMEMKQSSAPSERFQDTQQVAKAHEAADTTTPDSGFVKKPMKAKGSQLKQEIAAEVITGKGAGPSDVSSPTAYGLRGITFSGDTGTLLGSASETPTFNKPAQGDTRVEKRLSDANKDINYLASEQVAVEYDNVPPLAQSESTVGYNGNPKNLNARSQKKTGLTPAEILYDRSLDSLLQDNFVFSAGQVVKQKNVDDQAYPTKYYEYSTYAPDPEKPKVTITGWHELNDFPQVRGNYSPRELVVSFANDAGGSYVSGFQVLEDDYSINDASWDVVNKSSTQERIALNAAEIARQTIDADAGSPNAEHFNPLGRSVDQPSATVMYLRDVEQVTGSEIFAAYKFAQKARGHYLNRTAKDGQDLIGPAIDALYGLIMNASSSTVQKELFKGAQSTAEARRSPLICSKGQAFGSASLLLSIFDSVTKYKTKADVITQPRGLKLHLQTADNNMDPFRVNPNFVATLNSVDAYSTIDRAYDPMSAVCITDGVRLVHPYSWAKALQFTRESSGADRVYQSKLFTYKYAAGSGQNVYYIKVADPLLNAVAYFMEMHAQTIYGALADTSVDGVVTLRIPIVHCTTHFSLWDYLVCACTPYVIYERTNALKDILDYEMFYKYPFVDLVPIKSANPMNAVNYANPSAMMPLEVKQMLPSSAIRWTWPEKWTKIGRTDYLAPFYFSEDTYEPGGTNAVPVLKWTGSSNYSTPVIRSGVRLAYTDDFWGMEALDSMLCFDRMTVLPGCASNPNATVKGYIYKYSQNAEGIPVVQAAQTADWDYEVLHATPRQLGWFMPAYPGECSVWYDSQLADKNKHPFGRLIEGANTTFNGMSSFRAIEYHGVYTAGQQIADSILGPGAVSLSRAQSFTQEWAMRRSTDLFVNGQVFDLPLSLNDGFEMNNGKVEFSPSVTTFQPFTFSPYITDDKGKPVNVRTQTPAAVAFHRILWPIIQKTPFVINPFDDATGIVDPFDYAYMFNLAGFMSANYDEEDYNREMEYQNQGYLYTVDPMVAKSPVFRDAYHKTEIG